MNTMLLKKLFIFTSIFMMLVFLASCERQEVVYIDNPYFVDTSEHDFKSFFIQFTTYVRELHDYYSDTYVNTIFNHPFAYQWLPGFTHISNQSSYSKSELSVNDLLIDERELFFTSNMRRVFDNDSLFINLIDGYASCQENTLCVVEGTENYMHYSMHESKVFFNYQAEFFGNIYQYTFYMTKDENQKLHLEFLYVVKDGLFKEITRVEYVLYEEGIKEVNMTYQHILTMSHYDIQTKEKIEWSYWGNEYRNVTYYDPILETEFMTFVRDHDVHQNSNLTQYEQNHIKLHTDQHLRHMMIRLNQIDGWNRFVVLEDTNRAVGLLYQDDIPIDETMIVQYDVVTGKVYIELSGIPYYMPVEEDLITLERYGLSSGYTSLSILDMFEYFWTHFDLILERFDLLQDSSVIIQRFTEATGVEVDFT